MSALDPLIQSGRAIAGHGPWPRVDVDGAIWVEAVAGLEAARWSLLGLWAEPARVHMTLLDESAARLATFSLACPEGRFPSVGRVHPPALRLERAIRDLYGLEPVGLPETRPWLDHGTWGLRYPLGAREPAAGPEPYRFLPTEGQSLHQIPVGPVHAGIIEPGHFRFTAQGEIVVRLEQRLGYVHRGIEGLIAGADMARACQLAERVSGDSVVAYALGFCRAVEAAAGIVPPARAVLLRAVMAEIERLANHFGDVGAICNDASFALMLSQCAVEREALLRVADLAFGHRLMRDAIVPGGLARDALAEGLDALQALVARLTRRLPKLVKLYDETVSLQDRTVGTGIPKPALIAQYAPGGYIGRASGRTFDARRLPAYPPYDRLQFEVPSLAEGDVNARIWIRLREITQSLGLIDQILAILAPGPLRAAAALVPGREGAALVEGFRGDVLVWLRLGADQTIERVHLRDPSWFQWPLLEAAIEGNIVADFPLCNKSFNCSYAGQDL